MSDAIFVPLLLSLLDKITDYHIIIIPLPSGQNLFVINKDDVIESDGNKHSTW